MSERGAGMRKLLEEATSLEAQLALSYLIWPGEAPDPRVVDEWLRSRSKGITVRPDVGGGDSCGTNAPSSASS
jgi:hypothetical protein